MHNSSGREIPQTEDACFEEQDLANGQTLELPPCPPNAQVNPRVPTDDMIHQTRTAAHVGLDRLLGLTIPCIAQSANVE